MRWLRARQRAARGDHGVTIIEQLITMIVLTVVIGLVTSLVITTQKQTAAASLRLDDIDQARTAVDALSRTIRTAVEPAQLNLSCAACISPASQSNAVIDARTDSLQLFANSGSAAGPLLVTFTVTYDAVTGRADLTKTVEPADAGSAPDYTYTSCAIGPGCAITLATLVRGVVWPLTDPFFQYFDNSGLELVPAAGLSLTTPELIGIDSVGIHLAVRTPNPLLTSTSTVNSRIALPNAGTGVVASPTPLPSP